MVVVILAPKLTIVLRGRNRSKSHLLRTSSSRLWFPTVTCIFGYLLAWTGNGFSIIRHFLLNSSSVSLKSPIVSLSPQPAIFGPPYSSPWGSKSSIFGPPSCLLGPPSAIFGPPYSSPFRIRTSSPPLLQVYPFSVPWGRPPCIQSWLSHITG